MMCLNTNVRILLEEMGGTVFVTWVYRALGAKIGKNACIFGHAMEYDLLEVGRTIHFALGLRPPHLNAWRYLASWL